VFDDLLLNIPELMDPVQSPMTTRFKEQPETSEHSSVDSDEFEFSSDNVE